MGLRRRRLRAGCRPGRSSERHAGERRSEKSRDWLRRLRLLQAALAASAGWTSAPSLAMSVPLDDVVVPVDLQRLLLLVDHEIEEGEQVLGVEARGVDRDLSREVELAGDLHAVGLDDPAGLGELAVAAALGGEVDDHGAGLHARHHVARDEAGRRPPWDERGGDDDVLVLDVAGDQLGLLLLVLGRHRLGVARGRLRLLELLVLHRDELGAERLHLLLGGGAHVGRRDDRAEPTRGGDRLQAGDADAHDEGLGRGDRARRRHHHRQRLAEDRGGIDDGLVAGEVGLARQYVHRLRARGARHQLHGKKRGLRGRQRLQAGAVAVRVHDGRHDRARLQLGELLGARATHLEQDVGAGQRFFGGRGDLRALRLQHVVGEARTGSGARLHLHGAAQRDEFLDGVGRDRDARLVLALGRNCDGDHERFRSAGRHGRPVGRDERTMLDAVVPAPEV